MSDPADTGSDPDAVSDAGRIFDAAQPRLLAIAYTILGNRYEVGHVMQRARSWWAEATRSNMQASASCLVAATTRLALERLQSPALDTQAYAGWRLKQKLVDIVDDEDSAADHAAALAEEVELAFLSALRRIGAEEQAAFIMKNIFGQDYAHVASVLDRPVAACRQMVLRSQQQLRQERPGFHTHESARRALLLKFVQAAEDADHAAIRALVAEELAIINDSGLKTAFSVNSLHRDEWIAASYRRTGPASGRRDYRLCRINGEPGFLLYLNGKFESAHSFIIDDGRIIAIFQMHDVDTLTGMPLVLPFRLLTRHHR